MWCLLASLLLTSPADASERRTPVVVAVERATPSVVALEVEVPAQSPFFFGGPSVSASQGSGVVISADGVVLTNAHVVQGATRIRAHTLDGRSFEAHPIALEEALDLAVLRLDGAAGLAPITIADSDQLMLGETTIAIGNPYGLGLTVSTGVVASRDREVEIQPGVVQTYVQTDAAINPGNSGGALVDLDGRLIGINTAIRADAQGIGFAIPANRAKKIADDLLLYGSVRAPWLGCDFADVSRRALANTQLKGALRVTGVAERGPCGTAGLRPGDVVFHIDGRPTASRADLNAWLASRKPGDQVTLEYVRGEQIGVAKLATTDLPKDAGRRAVARLGVRVQPVESSALLVQQAAAGGTWVAARLRPGDVILAVDGRRITDEAELTEVLAAAKARHQPSALFTVQRGRVRGHVEVGI